MTAQDTSRTHMAAKDTWLTAHDRTARLHRICDYTARSHDSTRHNYVHTTQSTLHVTQLRHVTSQHT